MAFVTLVRTEVAIQPRLDEVEYFVSQKWFDRVALVVNVILLVFNVRSPPVLFVTNRRISPRKFTSRDLVLTALLNLKPFGCIFGILVHGLFDGVGPIVAGTGLNGKDFSIEYRLSVFPEECVRIGVR